MKRMTSWLATIKANKVLKAFKLYMQRANMGQSSPMLAYYSLLALFPAIIALGAILPYIGVDLNSTIRFVKQILPANISAVLIPLITSVLKQQSVSLFSIGLLVTLWSLSQVIANFRNRAEVIYGVKNVKATWLVRMISMGWILLLLLVQVILMVFVTLSRPFFDQLIRIVPDTTALIQTIERAQWPVTMVTLFVGITLINYAMIPTHRPRVKPLIIGSIIETIAFLVLTQAFGLYVKLAANRYTFYQAIGSIIILLIWLNLVAMIALLGVVIIATLTSLADQKYQTNTFSHRQIQGAQQHSFKIRLTKQKQHNHIREKNNVSE